MCWFCVMCRLSLCSIFIWLCIMVVWFSLINGGCFVMGGVVVMVLVCGLRFDNLGF